MSQVLINSLSPLHFPFHIYTSVRYVLYSTLAHMGDACMVTVVVQCVSIKGPGDEANLSVANLSATYMLKTRCHIGLLAFLRYGNFSTNDCNNMHGSHKHEAQSMCPSESLVVAKMVCT